MLIAAGTLVTVTGPNAPVTVIYNPPSYLTPTDYSGNFTLSSGAVSQKIGRMELAKHLT